MKAPISALMMSLFLTASVAGAASVSDDAALKTRTIDLTQRFTDAAVDMSKFAQVRIVVGSDRAKPEISTESDLADCTIDSIRLISAETYEIQVGFQAQMDDGRNACTVKIRQSGGRVAQVELFLDIID